MITAESILEMSKTLGKLTDLTGRMAVVMDELSKRIITLEKRLTDHESPKLYGPGAKALDPIS